MLGTSEILLIIFAVMILFGAPKVLEWARTLGKAKKEYETSYSESNAHIEDKKEVKK